MHIAHLHLDVIRGDDLAHLPGNGGRERARVIADDYGRLGKALPRKLAEGICDPQRVLVGLALVDTHAPGVAKEVNDAHESILHRKA